MQMDASGKPRRFDVTHLRKAQEPPHASRAQPEAADDAAPGPNNALTVRSRVVDVSSGYLAAQRILPAGAAGPAGIAYKMLRTQVLRRLEQLGANTLAIVGAAEGAGKTLTAINLAIAIAAETSRTALVVDLDLRRPSIHRYFGFVPVNGVEECLLDGVPAQAAMVKVQGYDRLALLPARQLVAKSSELLADQATGDLVRELQQRYLNRIVIFDLPPALQADDALAFSRHVQAGLLVVREGHTQRDDVARSLELLHELKFVGTVLNAARDKPVAYY
jgi:Mrp family chromosome partitioning ATPase